MNAAPQEPEELTLHQHTARGDDGRNVAVWHLAPPKTGGRPALPPILVAPGFARRMDHLCVPAMYLADNGFDVYRYDTLDHIGLSDGTIANFSMTSLFVSLRTVLDWLVEERGAQSIGLVAMSLTARAAYALAAESPAIAFVITAVGVVNLRRTLQSVWGLDLPLIAPEDLPDFVEFEKHHIESRNFCADAHREDWWSLEKTIRHLRSARAPITCFASLDDAWVDPIELRDAFEQGRGGPRHIVELEHGAHDLGRNPSAARIFFRHTTKAALELAGAGARPVVEPRFERMTRQALVERRLARAAARREPVPPGRIQPMLRHLAAAERTRVAG